ncbi:hypothetical protein IE53DRAFT_363326 [Violaceomyces palustris]|uniref:Uncharacterized protein n=1 Tax=Violaceomyces palustris TaxID=1673888 RepID=A0ACD0NTT3_9BASI|nr:hypothetical protein IE53DRAFT_363326 [Violaceomyces palustris]
MNLGPLITSNLLLLNLIRTTMISCSPLVGDVQTYEARRAWANEARVRIKAYLAAGEEGGRIPWRSKYGPDGPPSTLEEGSPSDHPESPGGSSGRLWQESKVQVTTIPRDGRPTSPSSPSVVTGPLNQGTPIGSSEPQRSEVLPKLSGSKRYGEEMDEVGSRIQPAEEKNESFGQSHRSLPPGGGTIDRLGSGRTGTLTGTTLSRSSSSPPPTLEPEIPPGTEGTRRQNGSIEGSRTTLPEKVASKTFKRKGSRIIYKKWKGENLPRNSRPVLPDLLSRGKSLAKIGLYGGIAIGALASLSIYAVKERLKQGGKVSKVEDGGESRST